MHPSGATQNGSPSLCISTQGKVEHTTQTSFGRNQRANRLIHTHAHTRSRRKFSNTADFWEFHGTSVPNGVYVGVRHPERRRGECEGVEGKGKLYRLVQDAAICRRQVCQATSIRDETQSMQLFAERVRFRGVFLPKPYTYSRRNFRQLFGKKGKPKSKSKPGTR